MPNHEEIYLSQAKAYDAMIERQPDLSAVIREIRSYEGQDVLDLGAGSGRQSSFLSPAVKSLVCTDISQSMLEFLDDKLEKQSAAASKNWTTLTADHRKLPIADSSIDLIVSGWSICYLTNSNVAEWQNNLTQITAELHRVLRPNGTIVIFETLGTGAPTPSPPDILKPYYAELENTYHFNHKWIRTDYHFASNVREYGGSIAERLNMKGAFAMIIGFHHAQITIPKDKEQEARAFYCGDLGLKEIAKPESLAGRGGFWVEVGSQQLHIGTEDGVDRLRTKAHLAYEVEDIGKMEMLLNDNGIEILDSVPIPGFERFEFRDPFGNRVECIKRI